MEGWNLNNYSVGQDFSQGFCQLQETEKDGVVSPAEGSNKLGERNHQKNLAIASLFISIARAPTTKFLPPEGKSMTVSGGATCVNAYQAE